jgi:hypothetical protein
LFFASPVFRIMLLLNTILNTIHSIVCTSVDSVESKSLTPYCQMVDKNKPFRFSPSFEPSVVLASQSFASLSFFLASSSNFCNFKQLFPFLSKLFFLVIFKSIIVSHMVAAKPSDIATLCFWFQRCLIVY